MNRAAIMGVLLLASCVDVRTSTCDDLVCPLGTVCSTAHDICVLEEQVVACNGLEDRAPCSFSGVAAGECRAGVCFGLACGNGIVESGEVCDDGNTNDGDDCSADCRSDETCGNSIIDSRVGEVCDDGNNDDGDGCQANCALPTCGDGILDDGETCDDGNNEDFDDCNRQCTSDESCGNGVIDVHKGEECDDGNVEAGDACGPSCAIEVCGNEIVDPGEACDDGNVLAGDGCSADCRSVEVCGNGITDTAVGEECDDGNFLSLDGCSSTCRRGRVAWTALGAPSTRSNRSVVYDAARQRVVLFGGNDGVSDLMSDTWEWNGRGFLDVSLSGDDAPSGRIRAPLSYDARRKRVVLFGGYANGHVNDTWEWDGATWTDVSAKSATAPPGTGGAAMVYDAARGVTVLFAWPETWEWDGTTWTEVTPAGASPSERNSMAMSYDPIRGRVLLFGGAKGTSRFDDMWEWDGVAWTDVTPPTGPKPLPRYGAGMVFDAVRGQTVLFGGRGLFLPDDEYSDTWVWDGDSWTDVTPSAGPSPLPRFPAPMAYDVARQQVVLFGAQRHDGAGFVFVDDVWTWDGAAWTQRTPAASPGPREQHAMAYDPVRGRTVAFGGVDGAPLSGTWEWDGRQWLEVTPAGASPPPRIGHAMAYDPVRKHIVLFGGADATTFSSLSDTWTWDGAAWQDVTPGASPSARRGHELAFDRARGRLVLFGGCPATNGSDLTDCTGFNWLGDTWEWDGATWVDVTPADASPVRRMEAAVAYDAARAVTVLFGGLHTTVLPEPIAVDTWDWSGASWTEVPTLGVRPQARWAASLTYDDALGRPVLIGGLTQIGARADAWDFDGTSWRPLVPASRATPPPRGLHGAAYDAARGRIVVYGGNPFDVAQPMDSTTWQLAHTATGPEACHSGLDADTDGLVGCDDPDCWGYCAPLCPPNTTCDPAEPHCGDGVCNPALESPRMCPSDCGPPTAVCGDSLCDAGEDAAACPGDCAGGTP